MVNDPSLERLDERLQSIQQSVKENQSTLVGRLDKIELNIQMHLATKLEVNALHGWVIKIENEYKARCREIEKSLQERFFQVERELESDINEIKNKFVTLDRHWWTETPVRILGALIIGAFFTTIAIQIGWKP